MPISLPHRKSRYNPQELSTAQREIIRLDMLGMSINDIAEEMQVSRHHVRYVLASPLAMQMRQELQAQRDDKVVDITARLAQMCPKALEVMEETLNGDSVEATLPIRLRVCESVLDRCGFGKVVKTQSTNLTATLTAEEIENIRARARAYAVGASS